MNPSRIAFRVVVVFAFFGMVEVLRISTDGKTPVAAIIIVSVIEVGLITWACHLWKRAKKNDKGML